MFDIIKVEFFGFVKDSVKQSIKDLFQDQDQIAWTKTGSHIRKRKYNFYGVIDILEILFSCCYEIWNYFANIPNWFYEKTYETLIQLG